MGEYTNHESLFEVKGPSGTFILKKEMLTGLRIVFDVEGKKRLRILLSNGVEEVYEKYLPLIIAILEDV